MLLTISTSFHFLFCSRKVNIRYSEQIKNAIPKNTEVFKKVLNIAVLPNHVSKNPLKRTQNCILKWVRYGHGTEMKKKITSEEAVLSLKKVVFRLPFRKL